MMVSKCPKDVISKRNLRYQRVEAYYEHQTRDMSRPLPATPLTTHPPSVPQEALPQLAPLLDLLILSNP
ncbi:hypothetical protein Tco_1067114 [Tanacetum coccineum]|uniref:Uncharacterized protein n=1 Tax=Tanacetum coccineum TaxID=301880 RepID=A0ABQ5HBZ8_9ASTR